MLHPKTVEFDKRMKELFDKVDHYIEDKYGDMYHLHPTRPLRGETPNPEADGLFDIGARFTPGFGSELGRGYLVDMVMSTPEKVDPAVRRKIYDDIAKKIKEFLPLHFPERELTVRRDRNHFKIQGDFSLGDK